MNEKRINRIFQVSTIVIVIVIIFSLFTPIKDRGIEGHILLKSIDSNKIIYSGLSEKLSEYYVTKMDVADVNQSYEITPKNDTRLRIILFKYFHGDAFVSGELEYYPNAIKIGGNNIKYNEQKWIIQNGIQVLLSKFNISLDVSSIEYEDFGADWKVFGVTCFLIPALFAILTTILVSYWIWKRKPR